MVQRSTAKGDASNLVRTWTEFQRQLWDNWMELSQTGAGQASETPWLQPLDLFKVLITSNLKVQADLSKVWLRYVYPLMSAAPGSADRWLDEMEGMIDSWKDLQQHACNAGLLAATKQPALVPAGSSVSRSAPPDQDPIDTTITMWQDVAEKTLAVQSEWMSLMTSMVPGEHSEEANNKADNGQTAGATATNSSSQGTTNQSQKKSRGRPRKQSGSRDSAQS